MGTRAKRTVFLVRGLKGQCPRCRSARIFASRYRLQEKCPGCGLPLEKEDGWSLGAIPLNYAFTCLFWILPVALAFIAGALGLAAALILAGTGAILRPFITYRLSTSVWVGVYYAVLPHELDLQPGKKNGAPADAGTP